MELQKSLLVNIAAAKDALAFGDNNSSLYEAIITQFRNSCKQKNRSAYRLLMAE